MNERTNVTDSGYTYNGQNYQNVNKTDSQGNPYTVAIPTSMLATPASPINVTAPTPTVPQVAPTLAYIANSANTAQSNVDALNKQAQTESSSIAALQSALGNKASDLATQYQTKDATGRSVNDIASQLRQLNAQSQALGLENQAKTLAEQNAATGQNVTSAAVQRNTADATRENTIKLAGIAMQTAIAQADYATAKDYADQMINAKYDKITADIEAKKTNLQAAIDFGLKPAQQKQAELQQQLLKQQEQAIAEQKANESKIQDLIINASQQGAPANIKNLASKAATPMEAAKILGQYAGDYWGTKYKIAQINKMNADAEETRAKIAAAGGVGSNKSVDTQTQAKFLLDTIAEATSLSGASGRSKARRGAEAYLTGATDYTNLEAKVRTVKNNLLTLATDPNIKKFFGPQMTDNDVKNMLAAATTLDTEGQSPEQLKAELNRVNGIFQKFAPGYTPATAVKQDAPTWASSIKNALLSPSQGGNYGYQDNTQ